MKQYNTHKIFKKYTNIEVRTRILQNTKTTKLEKGQQVQIQMTNNNNIKNT